MDGIIVDNVTHNEEDALPRRTAPADHIAVYGDPLDPANDTEELPRAPPKTDEQRRDLVKILSKLIVFSSVEQRLLNDVIDFMFEKTVLKGEVVFNEGDSGDHFYVVRSGTFDSLKGGKLVNTFNVGDSFGELSLFYSTGRPSTVKARTDGTLWQLERLTYRRYLTRVGYLRTQWLEKQIKSVRILVALSDEEVMKLADVIERKEFSDGQVIFSQGDIGDGLYFVEEGQVSVLVQQGSSTEHIDVLEKGAYFGELALITKNPRAATIVARGPTVCAFVSAETFENLFGQCVDIMKRNIPGYEEQLIDKFGSSQPVKGLP